MENELLLENISEQVKVFYIEKVLGKLKPEDCELLRCYFGNDMSLQKTAQQMFLHKNSLQYRLNHIWKISGYNPRGFRGHFCKNFISNIFQFDTHAPSSSYHN